MFNPISTYRIQFHKDFTFSHLEEIIPYLGNLGIKTLYASPIFSAVPGSNHGYDGIDPLAINPEIGTLEQLRSISKRLKKQGISWLQDIVPNHMAFNQDNAWLMDVLEKGPLSQFKNYFDQSLADSTLFEGPIMVPFLGDDLNNVIEAGDIKLDLKDSKPVLIYAEQTWPLNLRSYATILQAGNAELTEAVQQLNKQITDLENITDLEEYYDAADLLKSNLGLQLNGDEFRQYLQICLSNINNDKQLLQVIAEDQYYRLCNWKETDEHINYRRFFTVNSLICLNIQREEVFAHFNSLIKTLIEEGIFQGLRIDHIDGLYDPLQYLQRLRALTGEETYIVVEKILESGEKLPSSWPIQGTTGYDFLAQANNLFTDAGSEKAFTEFYEQLAESTKSVKKQIHDKKALILTGHMNGELENLTRLFMDSDLFSSENNDKINSGELKEAIAQMLIRFPVYRFYGNSFPLSQAESSSLEGILNKANKKHPELTNGIALLKWALIDEPKTADAEFNKSALRFYQRCMQFTGPLMAKGVEDTLMYTYNRFIDHNEVGDSPDAFGLTIDEFHEMMQKRQADWPLALNGTATHDTKRGEDVRSRLNALTGIANEWLQIVGEWQKLNNDIRSENGPDGNDEYFIYQTLIGAYPMPGQDDQDFESRLIEYLEKMLREAKRHSNWAQPNEEYEDSAKHFSVALLDKSRPFWKSFSDFHQKVCDMGICNSLAQVTLKLTCPGVPDIYQGCEHWDLSLVDPDNRRPVDYELRQQLFDETEGISPNDLWNDRANGNIKAWLINKLLKFRLKNTALFSKGTYHPIQVKGKYKDQVIAFARVYKNNWIIVVAPINAAAIAGLPNDVDWNDTCIVLPENAPSNSVDMLAGTTKDLSKEIKLNDLLHEFPVAVLKLTRPYGGRSAGILMHITSLPSRFGIGDLGVEARKFANLLHDSYQQYWQILPLNSTSAADSYSPYSSYSSQAGNTLLISPDILAEDGLLTQGDLKEAFAPETDQADFNQVEEAKNILLETAWRSFQNTNRGVIKEQFEHFCNKEANWLEDYAIYTALKRHNEDRPWYEWEQGYKFRDANTLAGFAKENKNAIEKAKWLQYIFYKQWSDLKAYCNQLGVKIFGDLPFYISYDSVDVWSNTEIFNLDDELRMISVSGVPPDYFNADGQRWGMPIYKWDKLKETNYDWWVKRISKNLKWYDLLRLDHFRAFAAYWDIPAEDKTAINGEWVVGSRDDFFNVLKDTFKKLPFIAEDLGDIDEPVHKLMDEFDLPGMKVMQFAFGDDMPQSAYAPHHHIQNSFVYTGTHDNNTTLGWYLNDAGSTAQKNIERYTGLKVNKKNINKALIKTTLASVCKTAIIPIQDWLNLDETARMNTPAGEGSNWTWRLTNKLLEKYPTKRIKKWMIMYDRL
jgi:malto-oligosyltrehalose synthase/4-alpha-glucanotransferase